MMTYLKKWLSKKAAGQQPSRQQLKREVRKGAEEAVKKYRRVFERISDYDRA